MSYIVTRPTKSRGIAALLVFFFWPIGMFYSTLTGALLMSFVIGPVVLWASLSSGLGLILLPFYFLSCLIWAILAVNNYNRKIIREGHHYNNKMSKQLIDSNIESKYNQQEKDELRYDIKRLKILYDTNVIDGNKYEMQKDIIEKKIYDLENRKDYQQTYPRQEILNERKTSILPLLFIFLAIFLIGCILYDSKTSSFKIDRITSIFSTQQSKEKEEIKKQLEKTYFDVLNGKYTAQNFTGGVETPFYNTNVNTLVVMGFGPLATFTGNLKVEPSNIEVYELNEDSNTAKLKYDIKIITKEDTVSGKIDMDAKRIGGIWKFNAERFFKSPEPKKENKKYLKINADKTYDEVLKLEKNASSYKVFSETYDNGQSKDFSNKKILISKDNIYIFLDDLLIREWNILKVELDDEDTAYMLDNGDIIYQLGEDISLFDKRSKKNIQYTTEEILK